MTTDRAPSPRPGPLAAFVLFLWRHRFLVTGVVGVSTLATIIYVLVVPVEYTATATLLPQGGASLALMAQARSLLGDRLSSLGLNAPSSELETQVAILNSDHLADLVDRDLDLTARYKPRSRESRLRLWHSLCQVGTTKQGVLTVSYRDRDPEFAVTVVKSVLDHLDRFNRSTRSTSSHRVRVFLEERLEVTRKRLEALEDSLAAFQSESRTLSSSGNDGALAAGASLLTERIRMQMDAEVLRHSLGSDAPALQQKEAEIRAMDRELAKLPGLNSQLARLIRAKEVQERTFAFVSAQLEQARIEEARNVPTVDVLDPPVKPTEKTWPQRTWTVLTVFFISGGLALAAAKLSDVLREAVRAGSRGV